MPEKPNVDSIFLKAAEIEQTEKRAAFVQEACGEDSRRRSEVEKLLAAHDQAGSFMRESDGPSPTIDQQSPYLDEGTEIGNYKLLQRIGEGGFGSVYMAEQLRPVRRKVALKLVKPGMDSRDVIARFEAERQALALMDHPNIAKVLDAGTTDAGRPYFVMELVKGVPITEYCDKNRLNTRDRLELFVTLCHAVQHAHQKGVIHRDIKPSNIMVTLHDGKPVPKVIDFGVSKALNQQLTEKTLFTRYGQMIGTPQYMSPEQAEMSGLDVDTRSDIYSLGVVLYELLIGRTPLESERLRSASYVEMQRMIRDEEPPRPSVRLSTLGEELTIVAKDRSVDPGKLRQTICGELDWIVMRALEKDRGRRYTTASSFADDVARYLGDEPIEACPPSTVYRFRKFARRNKGPVVAALAVSTALVIGVIVATVGMVHANTARRHAEALAADLDEAVRQKSTLADQEQKAREKAEQTSKTLDETLYAQRIARAYQYVLDNRPIEALRLLEVCPPHLRDWEWDYVKRRCHVKDQRPFEVLGRVRSISVRASDDTFGSELGEKVVVGLNNGKAILFDKHLEGDRQEFSFHDKTAEPRLMSWLQLSPTQDVLAAAASSDGAELRHLREQTLNFLKTEHPINSVAFSPKGKYLATVGRESKVRLWDVATGMPLDVLPLGDVWAWAVCFSPDGRSLAAGGTDGELRVWDVKTRRLRFEPERRHWAPVTSICFSSDSKRLVSASYDQFIRVRDSESGELVEEWSAGKGNISCVAYNPTGTRLASACSDGTVTIWNAANFQRLLVLSDHDEVPHALAFSENGKTLFSGGSGSQVHIWDGTPWDASLERKPRVLTGFKSRILALAINPLGSELAAGGEDGAVMTWGLPSGQLKKEIHEHGEFGVVFALEYEPDGTHVISSGGSDEGFSVVRRWNTQTQTEADAYPPINRDLGEAFSVAINPAGDRFVVGGANGQLQVYEINSGKPVGILGRHERPIETMAFAPKRPFLVSASDEREIKLWNSEHLEESQEGEILLDCQGTWNLQMGFHPDGQLLALGDGKDVLLYNLETRAEIGRLSGHGDAVNATVFSHDGKIIASGSTDGTVKLWDANTSELIETLLAEGAVYRVAFTPDDDLLATAGEDPEVKLWNLSFLKKDTLSSDRHGSLENANSD